MINFLHCFTETFSLNSAFDVFYLKSLPTLNREEHLEKIRRSRIPCLDCLCVPPCTQQTETNGALNRFLLVLRCSD